MADIFPQVHYLSLYRCHFIPSEVSAFRLLDSWDISPSGTYFPNEAGVLVPVSLLDQPSFVRFCHKVLWEACIAVQASKPSSLPPLVIDLGPFFDASKRDSLWKLERDLRSLQAASGEAAKVQFKLIC